MKVTFFGHNCYVLQGENVVVLTDPWLSKKGAFFGSWFQWPINHHCMSNLLNDIQKNKKNFLYISHEHQDHFDKKTLKELRSELEIRLKDEVDKRLNNKIFT